MSDFAGNPLALAMPSPRTLRAPAVWITARGWALAAAERFGDAAVVTPEGTWKVEALDQLIDSMLARPAVAQPKRGRVQVELRTLAKDSRLAARHLRASWHTSGTGLESLPGGPFVWQHHDLFFTLGSRLALRANLPLVQFVDAPQVWEARRWGVRRPGWGSLLERAAEISQLKSADLIVCVSEGVAEAVQPLAGRTTSVIVTPCTADPSFFASHTNRSAVRQRFGLVDSDVAVGWSGSFRHFHAVDQLIKAFEKARGADAETTMKLVLVGDGPDRARLESLAQASQCSEAIIFTKQVPYSLMCDYVAAMDIAVVTARDDNGFHYSPLKLREYRAAGKAIVAPALGQIAAALTDGEDALLYQPGDVNELARKISTLAVDSHGRARLGSASRESELRRGGSLAQIDIVMRELKKI